MGNATVDQLGGLHGLLADTFIDLVKNGEVVKVTDKETGEVNALRVTPSAAVLAQARQFLKDNNIEATKANAKLKALADVLPFPTESTGTDA